MSEARNYSRGYLPHRNAPGKTQFVTWRLHDALDAEEWVRWKSLYLGQADSRESYRLAETHLDTHRGSAVLRAPPIGRIMMETLFEGHRELYELRAAAVMPNHVHAVLHVDDGVELSKVVGQIKGASARKINLALGRAGRFWQPDYFDRLIRSEAHLERCVGYVHWNPVKAGLCEDPCHYASSTANPHYSNRLNDD